MRALQIGHLFSFFRQSQHTRCMQLNDGSLVVVQHTTQVVSTVSNI